MSRIRAILWCLLILAVFTASIPACGKKGPPFLPEKRSEVKVGQLTGKWVDGRISLEGTIEGTDKGSDVTGCRIYRAWYPEGHSPCEGCLIEMAEFTDKVETTVSGDRFACVVPVAENEGIWFLEVCLIDSRGAVGPPSERVKVTMD